MNEEQLKKGILELINYFRENSQKYRDEQEANTETDLVEPLFKLLGWEKGSFVKRESARREGKKGFADYGFKIDGRIVFFLEVKKVGIPLEKEADKQVISYALSKRVPFAVSTNFEELKIFCVEQENATTQIFRVFKKPEDYISNLQNLMLLSKESFEKNLILKEAENEGRLKKRMSMDKIPLYNYSAIPSCRSLRKTEGLFSFNILTSKILSPEPGTTVKARTSQASALSINVLAPSFANLYLFLTKSKSLLAINFNLGLISSFIIIF